jgi:hypothetical protein
MIAFDPIPLPRGRQRAAPASLTFQRVFRPWRRTATADRQRAEPCIDASVCLATGATPACLREHRQPISDQAGRRARRIAPTASKALGCRAARGHSIEVSAIKKRSLSAQVLYVVPQLLSEWT